MRALLPGLLAVLIAFFLPTAVRAQDAGVEPSSDGVRIALGGGIQARVGYGWDEPAERERLGVGIRRARFRMGAALTEGAGLFIQTEAGGGAFFVLDFLAYYRVSPQWQFRIGRLVSAQPRSLILTGYTSLDALDRPAIAERYGRRTIGGDGRDFGIDAERTTDRTHLLLFVGSGDGSWSGARGNFAPGISGLNTTNGTERLGLRVAAYGALTPAPGAEVGGFVGYNTSENPNALGRTYLAYSAHAYWGPAPGSRPLRLKLDVIGTRYEEVGAGWGRFGELPAALAARADRSSFTQHVLGVSGLAAVRVAPGAEALVRLERETLDLGLDGLDPALFVTVAASFSPSARRGLDYGRQRVTLAYQYGEGAGGGRHHLLAAEFQLTF